MNQTQKALKEALACLRRAQDHAARHGAAAIVQELNDAKVRIVEAYFASEKA